ncbi:hypothetical protein [Henriciella marina]|uniref:hypothetical protein n=1 Tax=Henriciella marina TaxID=453851 RepID=UPI00037ABA95|nr:hypothetical protein [Henriciella marina]
MSGATLGFFIAGVLVAFLFALAVQMRVMAGLVLRRAAQAKFSELKDGTARFAVVHAVAGTDKLDAGDAVGEAATWLRTEYPAAIRHIKIARVATAVTAVLVLAVLIGWRFTVGGEG